MLVSGRVYQLDMENSGFGFGISNPEKFRRIWMIPLSHFKKEPRTRLPNPCGDISGDSNLMPGRQHVSYATYTSPKLALHFRSKF